MLKSTGNLLQYTTFIISIIAFELLSIGFNKASAQQLKVDVETAQNAGVHSKVLKKTSGEANSYTVKLSNTSNKDQNLISINITIQNDKLIPSGTSYMVGADIGSVSHIKQQISGPSDFPDNSSMFLLFKQGESDYLLIGVASWQTFLCEISTKDGLINIKGNGDNKLIRKNETIDFENIIILKGRSWQDLLYKYGDVIAKVNNIKPARDVDWQGWSTWDFYTQNFTADDISENIKALQKLNVKTNIIQIDGGWWKKRGDYFVARDNLPGGIKAIVEKIHAAGYKAGLHFDGFVASDSATIVKEHPEYFIHNAKGGMKFNYEGKRPVVYWDYSNPMALKHITEVMRNARENWGVDYFKIDFMRRGLFSGVSYLPVTNLERFRMGIKAMREGMGKDAYFLACGPVIGTILGLVDGSRVGEDIGPIYKYVNERAKQTSGNFYLHRKIVNVDPDYLVFRSEQENDPKQVKRANLTYDQAKMWANYVTIFGNVRMESDNINLLQPEKKRLIQKAFNTPFFSKVLPIDFWDSYKTATDAPQLFLAETDKGEICIGLFNWEEGHKKFTVSGFKGNSTLEEIEGDKKINVTGEPFSLSLKGTQSILLQYNGRETFDELRKQLKLESNPQ